MLTELSHRERVLRTIEHRDIDRIPMFFRAETVVKEKIKERHNLKEDMDIVKFYDTDAIWVPVSYNNINDGSTEGNGIFMDEFGNKHRMVEYGDTFTYTIIEPVLADAEEPGDVYRIKWPDKSYVNIEESLKQAQEARSTGLAVYGGIYASPFTNSRYMLGEEKYLISLIENPELVSSLVERLTDFYIETNEVYLSACSKYIDIFYFGSDFGTQHSMFISKNMFCRFFKPSIKRLVDHAKGFGLKVMYHTCGSVSDIIQDLIDCGVDILDPVQVSAVNMEPSVLAERFKNRIAFHGGINAQTTLLFGTPQKVREEVILAIDTFGPLGYIVSPEQDLIGNIPLDNIDAMFETIREYKV